MASIMFFFYNFTYLGRHFRPLGAILAVMVAAILDLKHGSTQSWLIKTSSGVFDHVSLFYCQNNWYLWLILWFSIHLGAILALLGTILAVMVAAILVLKHGIIQICLMMINKGYVTIFSGLISILSNTYDQNMIFG